MTACPICRAEATAKYGSSPYWICPSCDLWFQWPQPKKTFIAEFEGDPNVMSEQDKKVNKELANVLYHKVMGKPGKVLDIGAKYPYLASCLNDFGCVSLAMDHEPIKHNLAVVSLQGDFEEYGEWSPKQFDLITLVHTFEHLYDPLKAIKLLRHIVADDGAVFIRLPDHTVPGFERDLTIGHYEIHPFYHSLKSFLQLMMETNTFVVSDTWPMEGAGQRDMILRPIKQAPTIALGMIVKNEIRDLPRCLNSALGAYDVTWIVDTGSTDGTEYQAQEIYTEASDDQGRLKDFSRARNRYLDKVDAMADWVLCLDADDVLETPAAIRRASYCTSFDHYAMWIKDGNAKWITHRLWKTKLGIRFEGRCHEYPKLVGHGANMDDCVIRHHSDPVTGHENANRRNLRILVDEWNEDGESPRTAFYMANTHRDGERWAEAAHWYEKRIKMGEGFRDEWLFSHLYLVRCLRQLGDTNRAEWYLSQAVSNAKDWCEFFMEYANIAYSKGDYTTTISYAMRCFGQQIPFTTLWREPSAYTDAPVRLVSWCYEHMGKIKEALEWAKVAKEKIQGEDKDWDDRITRLSHLMQILPAYA